MPPWQTQILVVEDNPVDTLITLEAFKAAGMTSGLNSVKNGKDALAYVLRKGQYSDAPIPDVIFLDLSQPRVSGLEVLRVIKKTPELMHIPIVVAAGSQNPRFIRTVYALNGNCFIRKPAELTQFLRFIESCHDFWGSVVTLSPKIIERKRRRPNSLSKPVSSPERLIRSTRNGGRK
jgi:chemotaxis family two-component system response regulator Rcp1